MRFDTVLVANRGEIAVRILKTLRSRGLRSVAVFSEADRHSPHVTLADQAVCLGSGEALHSYLAIEKIISAARATGAGAIHPGYGFLSENADFAEACSQAGLTFIGPSPEAIRAMGDKSRAKQVMVAAGVPCVPGYHGQEQSDEVLRLEADKVGYPVMLKAAAGGGGKGMRLVNRADEFEAGLQIARSEAKAAFGSDHMLIEKALVRPRHIEFQIFGDEQGNVIHLGERDCSVQRRHQKILEEAPAPSFPENLRARMGKAAVTAAKAIGYVGAGTVEFLLDGANDFYFLEMNTRLQVEHPVTELVTGTDLVDWQIRIAQGEALPLAQSDLAMKGSAIEARLYAESPRNDFMPSSGRILQVEFPAMEGVRIDAGVQDGSEVSTFYDPMLAKLIAHGSTREIARQRLISALRGMTLFGLETNQTYLVDALEHPTFVHGQATTDFVETVEPMRATPDLCPALAAGILYMSQASHTRPRLTRPAFLELQIDGQVISTQIERRFDGLRVVIENKEYLLEDPAFDGKVWRATIGGIVLSGTAMVIGTSEVWLNFNGQTFCVRAAKSGATNADHTQGQQHIAAPMHGRVLSVPVSAGASVEAGTALVVLEAMKMQHTLKASTDGVLRAVHICEGDQVETGQVLVELDEAIS
ncbi:acetyl-CoA carboxylase biotin carboxylase subunit [Shimia sediminis]|uniref:acetyl-CoA carboxylase biotin carboxylase subunit n=1 Tax=Shimia sediminis TaxID=2497945 RepID=UPI0027BAFF12|nr:acetyl-CoA carboxylase biotin carboxylase subunit [Shimia sediminis]